MLTTHLSEQCRKFVVAQWGQAAIKQIQDRPVSWVRHEANPQLKLMRRKHKNVPLIEVTASANRIQLHLSTEAKA